MAAGAEGSASVSYPLATLHAEASVYCGSRDSGRLVGEAVGLQYQTGLSALSVSDGTLSPAFDQRKYDYEVSVPAATDRITVTPATVDEIGSFVWLQADLSTEVADADAETDGQQIDLPAGTTVFVVRATNASYPTYMADYAVRVTRRAASLPPLTPPAEAPAPKLDNLVLSRGLLSPAFAADVLSYTADARLDDARITVTPWKADPGSSVAYLDGDDAVIADADAETQGQQVDLELGANTIEVRVTSADGSSSETYTVTVTRNPVKTVRVSNQFTVTWRDPDPNGCAAGYSAAVGLVTSGSITFNTIASSVAVAVGAEGTASSSPAATFGHWEGRVNCGSREIGRATSLIGSARVYGLTLSSGTLQPEFATRHFDYAATVASGVEQIAVTPTLSGSSNVSVAYLDAGLSALADANTDETGFQVDLGAGTTVFVLKVTFTTYSQKPGYYVLRVTRPEPSTDATLGDLTLSGVPLDTTFDSDTTDYTASVENDVETTTVTPTPNDGARYVIKLGGTEDADGIIDGIIELAVGENVITVEVTAEDGVVTRTYTVTVTRAGSSNAYLRALTVPGQTLAPAFDKDTLEYRVSVVHSVMSLQVGAWTEHPQATWTATFNGADANQHLPYSLSVGSGNVIRVIVTPEDGGTPKTYQITVTRAAAPTGAALSGLTFSGIDFGAFDSATTGYTAEVGYDVAETTVNPTVNHDGATYVIKLDGVADADGAVELAVGESVITIEVTAEDGNASKTYTVTLTRAEAPAPPEPEPDSPPGVPDTPTGEVTGQGQATLDWNDVAGAAYYQVRFWDATDWVELPTGDIGIEFDGSGASISNLPDYGFYYFAVRAGNAAGPVGLVGVRHPGRP